MIYISENVTKHQLAARVFSSTEKQSRGCLTNVPNLISVKQSGSHLFASPNKYFSVTQTKSSNQANMDRQFQPSTSSEKTGEEPKSAGTSYQAGTGCSSVRFIFYSVIFYRLNTYVCRLTFGNKFSYFLNWSSGQKRLWSAAERQTTRQTSSQSPC